MSKPNKAEKAKKTAVRIMCGMLAGIMVLSVMYYLLPMW